MLRFILDHINTKKICKRLVKILPSLITHVSDRYKTQEMCDKAVNTCFFVFNFVPDR